MHLVGRNSDITVVQYMYNWLLAEIEQLIKTFAYGKGKAYVNSFALGCVTGINESLSLERTKLQQVENQSAAMVLLSNRKDAAMSFIANNFKNVKHIDMNAKISDDDAFYEGAHAGRNIDLNTKKLEA